MVSIIFPTYNEEGNLLALYENLNTVLSKIQFENFDFIFVNDCSTDRTQQILQQLHKSDNRVKIIRFSRNCGSHAAISAGLNYCRGEAAIVMAADLQDPPEIIPMLLNEWKKGTRLVWGARSKHKGRKFSIKFFSRLYYVAMNKLTAVNMPPLGADVFLVDRVVIDAFKQMPEKHSSVFMVISWLGFPQSTIEYIKRHRYKGHSKWTLGKKIKLFVDSLLSFSDVFIRLISIFGIIISAVGFLYASYILFSYFFLKIPIQKGWASLIVVILLIGGVQMMMIGVLGEYIWRTFDESRKRPWYVIESMEGFKKQEQTDDIKVNNGSNFI